MRLRLIGILACGVLLPNVARATMFNVTLTSGEGQFPGKLAAAFGNTAGPVDVDLTPDAAGSLPISQFSGFIQNQVFAYEPGASTTFTQTLTVNGVSTTVTRTITLEKGGGACTLVQRLSPVAMTVDLGVQGKVTLELATPPTLAFPCVGDKPATSGIIIIIPGTSTQIGAAVLDDFVLYKVKGSKGAPKFSSFGPVDLADVFDLSEYDVVGVAALGLPAGKNGGAIFDDDTHLANYRFKRRKSGGKFPKIPDVGILNECGELFVTLIKPESLLVPVNENASTLPPEPDPQTSLVDHFLCYKAKAQKKRLFDGARVAVLPKHVQLDASDHFQTRRYDVKKVTRVCLPVDKSGSPVVLKTSEPKPITPASVRHPEGSLVCYQVKPAKSTIAQNGCGPLAPKDKGAKIASPTKHQKQLGLLVNGQLGSLTLDTAKELEICVPQTTELPLN